MKILHSFDALVLLTSVPSETSILSKYDSYKSFKNIVHWIYLYTNLFLKVYCSSIHFYFFLSTYLMCIITIWKVNIFSKGKALYESDFSETMINTICNTTSFTHKIFRLGILKVDFSVGRSVWPPFILQEELI